MAGPKKAIRIEGTEALKRALADLPKKLQNKVIRQALRAGAKVFSQEVKAEAPKETGALKRSTKVKAGKRKKDYLSVNVIVTGGHPDSVPIFVEYGTVKMEADPFLARSFDKRESAVETGLINDIAEGAEREGL